MDYEEVVTTRRSLHEYDEERDVSEETLERIFERATYAPSSFNLQPWEFLVVREDEALATLAEVANGQEHIEQASATVVVLGDKDPARHADPVFQDWLDKGYIPDEETKGYLVDTVEGMRDLPEDERRVWTNRSTALAAQQFMTAAWNEGVATLPMEGFDDDALVEAFDVGDEYDPVMLIAVGYPADDAGELEAERKYRRPVEEVVHYDTFDPVEETAIADEQAEEASVNADD
ncbi:nitroreductase family protein [Halobaculum lipolyticum]|uniref:Nitroreductase family protein n=1 Tax=Halobaculum lipolyticum TaxID=3032001 RepID=A0ABD5W6I1_9EURY|nr:nitroreductase family protein [Halobaculum sp. DT31]